ncbi:hypothetical protein NB311A_11277 [Nitrobacter sp. Nb-311A]|nr:hypothetical protein NB311A_11277 [Nitrobacter sp. Nb-311A]
MASPRDHAALFEGDANPVPLDPDDSAVDHDAAMLCYQLKPIGNVARIWYIDSAPISGNIYDATADARPIATYLRGMIDSCP